MDLPQYEIKKIADIIGGELIKFSKDNYIKNLVIDSRRLITSQHSLFFAIHGQRHDGHQYMQDLYRKGVRNFVISRFSENVDLFFGANIIKVKDSLEALQKLAAYHRSRFPIKSIAITGSNGKTIVKEWLFQLLQEDYSIVRSPKSYNSQVGVPLSIWNINDAYNMGIFEAGISEPGEMENLSEIIQPEIGIITNIGPAHQENFQSYKEKIREKLKLFGNVNTLIFCSDYNELEEEIYADKKLKNKRILSWSVEKSADLQITSRESSPMGTSISADYKNRNISISIPFSDKASMENALHCWLLMLHLEIPDAIIKERMAHIVAVAMRLELLDGINQCSIINDVYNSDLGSLEIALDVLNQQKQNSKRTVILSDILQSGIDKKILYEQVAASLQEKEVSRLTGIGPDISQYKNLFEGIETEFYLNTEEFLSKFRNEKYHNETILIKGARRFKFEKISSILQQKAHETVLEINLNSLIYNLNYFKNKLRPGTKIMAMVKAFSYGSGSFEIANLLEFNRIEYLAVAYADEGIDLRRAGISTAIVVMNPEISGFEAMIRYRMEPEIYNLKTLEGFVKELKNKGLGKAFPIHIKLDTGMKRLGFESKDLPVLCQKLKMHKEIEVASIFSHLVGSDNPGLDDFTLLQIERFKKMAAIVEQAIGYKTLRHILNSAGISRFPHAQFDMVRLGIGMYGIGATKEDGENLHPVSRLKTIISQIKTVASGESVGYNRAAIAKDDITIAVLPIGYADGLNRILGNGRGKVCINGQKAAFIGNICMDMSMVDISHIPCKEGDDVEIFGKEISIEEFAEDLETIPYEVLTNISRRVKRVYYQD